ncbi:hypothetical protein Dimus_034823 [Dionaea muscipula]
MEEEKKKRKKKTNKKKNRQTKPTDDDAPPSAAPETESSTTSVHGHGVGQVAQDNGVDRISQSNTNGVHLANGTSGGGGGSILAESKLPDWVGKEARLQEMVKQLQHDKDSGIQRENSGKEIIVSLQDDNARLLIQVVELEEARQHLMQENQQLRDDTTALRWQIQDLENSLQNERSSSAIPKQDVAEVRDLNSQIEAAGALVEKLITENADLVEKVNQLYVELVRQTVRTGNRSAFLSDPVLASVDAAPIPDPMSEYSDGDATAISVESSKSFDGTLAEDAVRTADNYDNIETSVSGEIVQIPLDETETQDLESQTLIQEESEDVPFTDAPLIGAPFRLISFVAKYVTGADLVNKSSLTATP